MTKEYVREQLLELRKHEQFYCPQCQNPVQLKIGQVMIPHFAHKKQGSCNLSFSEGETTIHLLGKQQLYEMFQKLQLKVQLEPYLAKLAQRPDVLVESNHQQFAIEFQCSTISIPKMKARTNGYLQANMKPIWILKTPKHKQSYQDGIQQVQLSPFKQQFITYIQNHAHIITFDPETANFLYFSYLMPIGGYRFIAKVQHLSIETQHFPFLQVKKPTKGEFYLYWKLWKKVRQQFLSRRLLISKKGVQDPFLRACYFMGYQVETLPLFIGIPLSNKGNFSVFDAEWQMNWLMFLNEQGYSFTHVSSSAIDLFRKRYPTIWINNQAVKSLRNYNEILKKLEVTRMNSEFDEIALYQYLYSQFLAKGYEN